MKKLLSLLLSATLILSMFSLSAFAQETTKTEQWLENHSEEMHFRSAASDGKGTVFDVYIKNNKIFLKNMPSGGSFNMNMIFDGEKCVIYPTRFPLFRFELSLDGMENPFDLIPITESFTYVGNTTKTVGSKEYYVELFTGDEIYDESYSAVYEYWFDGEELKMITGVDDPDVKLEIVSTQVNDRVFKPPFFSINITPFFEFFFRVFGFDGII